MISEPPSDEFPLIQTLDDVLDQMVIPDPATRVLAFVPDDGPFEEAEDDYGDDGQPDYADEAVPLSDMGLDGFTQTTSQSVIISPEDAEYMAQRGQRDQWRMAVERWSRQLPWVTWGWITLSAMLLFLSRVPVTIAGAAMVGGVLLVHGAFVWWTTPGL